MLGIKEIISKPIKARIFKLKISWLVLLEISSCSTSKDNRNSPRAHPAPVLGDADLGRVSPGEPWVKRGGVASSVSVERGSNSYVSSGDLDSSSVSSELSSKPIHPQQQANRGVQRNRCES
jgi:hypothetical protein